MTSLEEKLVELVAVSAYVAFYNSISGNSSPSQQKYHDRMREPQVGDLVLENSNLRARAIDRLGRLESVDMEPPPHISKEDYDEEEYDGKPYPPYLEKVWRIETLDGRKFAWTNASFLVVPECTHGHQGDLNL